VKVTGWRRRWFTPEGRALVAAIQAAAAERRPLETVPGLGRHQGLWDLRGIPLWRPNEVVPEEEQDPVPPGRRVIELHHRVDWEGVHWTDLDLSEAHLGALKPLNCTFERVVLDGVEAAGFVDFGCYFTDVRSRRGRWSDATFGLGAGPLGRRIVRESRYERCRFEQCAFDRTTFSRPWFIDCDFGNSRFRRVWMNSSHFIRCRFAGLLYDVWFKGQDEFHPTVAPNPMEDVDFRDAVLEACIFTHGCDLSRVQFPLDGRHFLVRDPVQASARALAHIDELPESWRKYARTLLKVLGDLRPGEKLRVISGQDYEKFGRHYGHLSDEEARRFADWLLQAVGGEPPPVVAVQPPQPPRGLPEVGRTDSSS